MLRRLKTDKSIIDDLPDKIEQTERCPLTREQATLYQAVVDELLSRRGERGRHRPARRGPRRDHQAQTGVQPPGPLPRRRLVAGGRSGKLNRVEELLDEMVDVGDKALCFTQFAEWGNLLAPLPRPPVRHRAALVPRRGAPVQARGDGGAVPGRRRARRSSSCRSRPAAPASTSPRRRTSSTSTGGGTRRSRTRRPTARTASASAATCWSTSSCPAGTVEERIDEMISAQAGPRPRVVGSGRAVDHRARHRRTA